MEFQRLEHQGCRNQDLPFFPSPPGTCQRERDLRTSVLSAAEPAIHSISILAISYFLLLSAAHVFQDKYSFCLHIAQLGFRTVGGVSSSNLRPGILTSLFSPISHVPPLSVLSSLSHSFSFPVFTSFFG